MKTSFQRGLTDSFAPEVERGMERTPDGMAYWLGTGPKGKTCRECIFFASDKSYHSQSGKYGGQLKPAPCRKYKILALRAGPKIRATLASCKYFEASDNPPPLRRPK